MIYGSPEAYEDAVAEAARLRRILVDVVQALTPAAWHGSVETIQVLDKVKAVLPARERLKLTRWLASRT